MERKLAYKVVTGRLSVVSSSIAEAADNKIEFDTRIWNPDLLGSVSAIQLQGWYGPHYVQS